MKDTYTLARSVIVEKIEQFVCYSNFIPIIHKTLM